MAAKPQSKFVERRKSARREVLETFHVFLVIPQHGLRKIYLKDVSAGGMGFYGEEGDSFKSGQVVPCYFYINPSLKLPLKLKIAHATTEDAEDGSKRLKVGCEFDETKSKAYQAYSSFLSLLEQLSEFVED